MAESRQLAKGQDPTVKEDHRPKKEKVYVFVQKIGDRVMEIYNELHKVADITKDTRLAILKSTKVGPRALIRTLDDYKSGCKCVNLKQEIQSLIYQIEDLLPGGATQLFVCHSKSNLNTELEFVCGAVRKYKCEDGEIACDFVLSTYSYEKLVNKAALGFGVGSVVTGVLFGALAIGTAGAAPIILGSVGSILGGVGALTAKAALDTSLEEKTRDILEASFLHELVSRGHALLENRQLFITNQDRQPTGSNN